MRRPGRRVPPSGEAGSPVHASLPSLCGGAPPLGCCSGTTTVQRLCHTLVQGDFLRQQRRMVRSRPRSGDGIARHSFPGAATIAGPGAETPGSGGSGRTPGMARDCADSSGFSAGRRPETLAGDGGDSLGSPESHRLRRKARRERAPTGGGAGPRPATSSARGPDALGSAGARPRPANAGDEAAFPGGRPPCGRKMVPARGRGSLRTDGRPEGGRKLLPAWRRGAGNAGGGTRTRKGLLPPDFESGASASFATPAAVLRTKS